jgi:hypothetical protein
VATDFAKDLPNMLGKPITDPDIASFLKNLDSGEAIRLSSLNEPRWSSEAAGIEVHAGPKTKRIHTIFLFAEGFEDSQEYAGPLPHGLDFSMDMKQVEGCFTRPPDFGSAEHATWDFDDYRIIVTFGKAGRITGVNLTSDF